MKKWLVRIGWALAALVLLAAASGLLVLRTRWFQEKFRRRVAAELEKATGGRVEIDKVHFDARRWRGRLQGVTIHGSEDPGRKPLLHAAELDVDLKIVSFLERRVNVAALRLAAPEIHLEIAPDGSTNIPAPPSRAFTRPITAGLLDLAVGRFDVEGGELWVNDRRYAVELEICDLRLRTRLEQAALYTGRLEAGRVKFASAGPLRAAPPIERAAASFRLMRDRIEISELAANTALSSCKLHGSITNLVHPRWQFEYEANVDAREAARALPAPEIQSGRIRLRGSYDSGQSAGWIAAGSFSAEQVTASRKEFRVSHARLEGTYAWRPRKLQLDKLGVKALGGEWKGRLAADFERQPTQFFVQGRIEGLPLAELARAIPAVRDRWNALGWAAVISGPVEARGFWPLSVRNVSVMTDLALRPPENPAGLTGIMGAVRAFYNGRGAIDLSRLDLSSGGSSLTASGRVSEAGSTALEFRLQTARLQEVLHAAGAVSGEKVSLPARLNGSALMQGRISGTMAQPEIDAILKVSQFAYEGRDWDSLAARVQASRRQLRVTGARLTKGHTTAAANLAAVLQDGKLTANSPIEIEVLVREAQLADLAALAGRKIPVTGAATATLKLQGTQKAPRGTGRIEIRRGAIWGEAFDVMRSAIEIGAGEARFHDLQVVKGKQTIRGTVAFNPEDKSFRFDARGERVELADLPAFSNAPRRVGGIASFRARGWGRLAPDEAAMTKLEVDGDLRVQKLSVDGNALGDISALIRNNGDKLSIQAQSNIMGSRITAHADVLPRGRFPVQGGGEFRGLNLASVLQAAGAARLPVQIFADGDFGIEGNLRAPGFFHGSGILSRLETATAPGVRALRNAEPVRWRITDGRAYIEGLHLVGEGSDLTSSGWADLGASGALRASVKGSLNLAVLGSLQPGLEVGGLSTVDATITGTRRQPNIDGSLEIRNAAVGSQTSPVSLSGGKGLIRFSSQRATIQNMTAEVGGGEVSVTGDAVLSAGSVTYRLQADARQVRFRSQRGLSMVVEGALTLTGTNQRSLLRGEMRIVRAGTRASADLTTLLALLKQPPHTPSSNDWLQNAQLNIDIVTAPDIRFETSIARNFQAEANLRLRGTALNPSLLGRVNITEGDFEFQGTRFSINRGSFTFSNPFRIDPILNLDLETRVSGYDVTVTLAGTLQKLSVSYRSDPPLPFNEVITLLALGRAPTTDPTLAAQQTAQARSLAQLGASNVVGQAISRPSGRLQRFFGVSRLKVDPELAGPEKNLNARVTLEQQVGRDVTFTYTYNLASAQEQIVRLQWSLSKQFSLIAVRDENGVFGVDFLYKKRYR
jgi:translocation and assembly module TamB